MWRVLYVLYASSLKFEYITRVRVIFEQNMIIYNFIVRVSMRCKSVFLLWCGPLVLLFILYKKNKRYHQSDVMLLNASQEDGHSFWWKHENLKLWGRLITEQFFSIVVKVFLCKNKYLCGKFSALLRQPCIMMRLSMPPLPRISKLKVKNLFEIPMVFDWNLRFIRNTN